MMRHFCVSVCQVPDHIRPGDLSVGWARSRKKQNKVCPLQRFGSHMAAKGTRTHSHTLFFHTMVTKFGPNILHTQTGFFLGMGTHTDILLRVGYRNRYHYDTGSFPTGTYDLWHGFRCQLIYFSVWYVAAFPLGATSLQTFCTEPYGSSSTHQCHIIVTKPIR